MKPLRLSAEKRAALSPSRPDHVSAPAELRPHTHTATVVVYLALALLMLVPGALLKLDLGFGGSLADEPLQALRKALDDIQFGSGPRFWLGVAGFSMMALLILYPLRKALATRFSLGSVGSWFHLHLVLGIFGPVAILYHCNFGLGGKNANVALWTMLVVALSGIVGHFVYTSASADFYAGKERAREQLDAIAGLLNRLDCLHPARRRLIDDLEAFEATILAPRRGILASLAARWRIARDGTRLANAVLEHVRLSAVELQMSREDYERLRGAFRNHLRAYLAIARHTAGRSLREQIWARWRLFHLPVFLVMVTAAALHIYAVWDLEPASPVAAATEPAVPSAPAKSERATAPSRAALPDIKRVTTLPVASKTQPAAEIQAQAPAAKPDAPKVAAAPRPVRSPEAVQPTPVTTPAASKTQEPSPVVANTEPPRPVPKKRVVADAVPKPTAPAPVAPIASAPEVRPEPAKPAVKPPPPTPIERDAIAELQRRNDDQRMGLGGAKPRTLAEQIEAFKEKRRLQQFFHSEMETGFPLTGKHLKLDCAQCHKAPLHETRQAKVRTCIDCHRQDDIHRGKRPDCAQCHTTNRWSQIIRRK